MIQKKNWDWIKNNRGKRRKMAVRVRKMENLVAFIQFKIVLIRWEIVCQIKWDRLRRWKWKEALSFRLWGIAPEGWEDFRELRQCIFYMLCDYLKSRGKSST